MNSREIFISFHQNCDSCKNEKHQQTIVFFRMDLKVDSSDFSRHVDAKKSRFGIKKGPKSMSKERKSDQKLIKIYQIE